LVVHTGGGSTNCVGITTVQPAYGILHRERTFWSDATVLVDYVLITATKSVYVFGGA